MKDRREKTGVRSQKNCEAFFSFLASGCWVLSPEVTLSKPTFKRADRVGDQMKQEIADILMRKIKDPRIGFVTVTDVDVSDDLKNAKVFVSIYGDDKVETLKGLKSAAPFIRVELGRRLRLRVVPEILFRFDSTVEHGAHIMELLREIEQKEEKKDTGNE